MSRKGTRIGTIAAVSAAVVGACGTVAGAATPASPPTLAAIQAKAAAAITLRVNDLTTAVAKAQAATRLGSDGAALVAFLQADIAPLQALGQKIAGDTTASTAAADAATIFTNYRVLALVLPAARLAGAADVLQSTTIPKLTAQSTKAAAHVTPANAAVLQPLLTDLTTQLGDASSATNGLASSVLADTPSQWNANHDLLTADRSALQGAQANVTKARADLKQIAADLKGAAPTSTPTTAS